MKNQLCIILILLLSSCKQQLNPSKKSNIGSNEKSQSNSVFYQIKPEYTVRENLDNTCCNEISKKLTDSYGNFLGDNDDNDIYGHPDTDYDNLTIWDNPELKRKEIYFNAKSINKEYSLFIENDRILAVLEGKTDDEGTFQGDSIFFKDERLYLWKNSENEYVLDEETKLTKQKFLQKIFSEIKSIEGKTQDYINNFKSDSISSFVIWSIKD